MGIEQIPLRKHGPRTQARQAKLLGLVKQGLSIAEAVREVGVSRNAYYQWMKDPDFRELAQHAHASVPELKLPKNQKMGLESFRAAVLGRITYPHMQQWGEWFESEENDHILILVPPECAKTTFVLDYLLWRIYLDPDVRIGYASKSQPHAIKQVSKLKNIIEQNRLLRQITGDLVPGPGDPHPWRDQYFTVRARQWVAGEDEADYTCAAFGSGSQITGSRFDVLIFDDPDDVNIGASDRDKVWNVILQAGETRLGTSGRMIIIGNRQDELDVYSRILAQYEEDHELWSVYRQSAIMDDEKKEVIWPEKFGLPRKKMKGAIQPNGPWTKEMAYLFFDLKRRRLGSRFDLVYQNNPQTDLDRYFTREMLDECDDNMEVVGEYPAGSTLIFSLDPASKGGAAIVVYAVLPPFDGVRRRKIVDFEWGKDWGQPGTMDRIKLYGMKYKPLYYVIEESGHSSYLTTDPQLPRLIKSMGGHFIPITTGRNKAFGDFAVTSLRDLFVDELIVFPAATPSDIAQMEQLKVQFLNYKAETTPDGRIKYGIHPYDGCMAVWFAERLVRDMRLDIKERGLRSQMTAWKNPYGGSWQGQDAAWRFGKQNTQIFPGTMLNSPRDPSDPIIPR